MPVDSTSVSSISAVAATARNLYRRAKISGPDFADVATVVRPLHTVLKHLRAEAEDPDSLLNSAGQESSVYARHLTPIVEDTDFTLKQLDTILEKYGSYPGDYEDVENGRRDRGDFSGKQMSDRERDMISLIRTKLANQKTNIDIFLDTVQLNNPARQQSPVHLEQADDKQMNSIKDKVDAVAVRLFQRRARARASGDAAEESEEEMWQQFWTELVKEGFSSDVLRKHKEVLRAYIRELDSNGSLDGQPPSVRGLLDQRPPQMHANGAAYAPQQFLPYSDAPAYDSRQPQYESSTLPPRLPIVSAQYPSKPGGEITSPKELVSPNADNEKYMPSARLERRQPELCPINGDGRSPAGAGYNTNVPQQQHRGPSAPPASMPMQMSYERYSSDSNSDSSSTDSQQLALISTQDLIDIDRRDTDAIAARMGAMHLPPPSFPPNYSVSPGTSPNARHLPPPGTFQEQHPLPSDQPLSSSTGSQAPFGALPRYVPPIAAYGASPSTSAMAPPSAYTSADLVVTAPIPIPSSALSTSAPQTGATAAQRYSRLAPDSKGADIPMGARWTRIKRALVSPEVLAKAGVRYEARPDFVAVLGVLSREEIAHFARLSAKVRSSRGRGYSGTAPRPMFYPDEKRRPNGKRYRQSDTEDETDSQEVIWDESDTSDSDSESQYRTRDRSGPGAASTSKYIPRQHRRRRETNSTIQEEPELEDVESQDGWRRHRVYPVIVPPPFGINEEGSPAATVQPKPILKNRNENHVRFEKDGPREVSPGSVEREKDRRERRERRRTERERDGDRRRRDRDRGDRGDRDPERERERDRDSGRDRDRDRERERDRGDRERERERHRDRDRDRDHGHSSNYRGSHRDRSDRDEARDRRRVKKSVWGETLGAVGIGGAAASLLSVLTEAM